MPAIGGLAQSYWAFARKRNRLKTAKRCRFGFFTLLFIKHTFSLKIVLLLNQATSFPRKFHPNFVIERFLHLRDEVLDELYPSVHERRVRLAFADALDDRALEDKPRWCVKLDREARVTSSERRDEFAALKLQFRVQ